MASKVARRLKYSTVSLGLVLVLAMIVGAYFYPALAASTCPTCYGLERVAPTLILDPDLSADQRAKLETAIQSAEASIRAVYGSFDHRPILIACATETCDQRMGGRGARASVLSTPFVTIIRLSPRGLSTTILTHEFAHVALHHKIGVWNLLSGAVPAWFDEGVAVILSNDDRYLKPGQSAEERCVGHANTPLPTNAAEWASASGKIPMLYADAACRVLHWLDHNGGQDGLLYALDGIADGQKFQF